MFPEYKTIDDDPNMGLNNEICQSPVAFCKSKRVWLSEKDVIAKKCRKKLTTDMISYEKCKVLDEI